MVQSKDSRPVALPNFLAAKLGGQSGEPISEDVLKSAEGMVRELLTDYIAWVQGDLVTLAKVVDELTLSTTRASELLVRVRDILHNMKGNGSTFGYDLITEIAQSASDIVREIDAIDHDRLEALRHHVAALRVVADRKIIGSGGEPGQRLIGRLRDIAEPFLPSSK